VYLSKPVGKEKGEGLLLLGRFTSLSALDIEIEENVVLQLCSKGLNTGGPAPRKQTKSHRMGFIRQRMAVLKGVLLEIELDLKTQLILVTVVLSLQFSLSGVRAPNYIWGGL